MGIIHAPGLWSFVYSTNFQIKQIPASNIFLGNINTFSIKPKKIINLFSLRSRYRRLANRKKLILPLGNYIKTLKEHNFLIDVQLNSVRNNGVSMPVMLYRHLIGVVCLLGQFLYLLFYISFNISRYNFLQYCRIF